MDRPPPTTPATVMFIGAGLPPVPQKLVLRIQAGEYVDMVELLPDRLGISDFAFALFHICVVTTLPIYQDLKIS